MLGDYIADWNGNMGGVCPSWSRAGIGMSLVGALWASAAETDPMGGSFPGRGRVDWGGCVANETISFG
jgi:hypothetical protein